MMPVISLNEFSYMYITRIYKFERRRLGTDVENMKKKNSVSTENIVKKLLEL